MEGMGCLISSLKRTMESVLMPTPLFLAAWSIVLQMSPGREND